ncbi:MAG: MogA/MoaB family molybdenum cofactor biosynthesis protein [Planctomycetota bacterium]|jgi:molybdenum cofactor biosynthesis protein B
MSSSFADHERRAAAHARAQPVRCAVLTISDSRTPETDESGPLIERLLAESGHQVAARALVSDEPELIDRQLEAWLADRGIQAILTTGGTGLAARDTTVEVVRRLFAVELEGFGELFRMLSYQQVKAAAMLSRAVAGLVVREPAAGGETFIFALPGSADAVETALTNLIGPQLAHLVWERRK